MLKLFFQEKAESASYHRFKDAIREYSKTIDLPDQVCLLSSITSNLTLFYYLFKNNYRVFTTLTSFS